MFLPLFPFLLYFFYPRLFDTAQSRWEDRFFDE